MQIYQSSEIFSSSLGILYHVLRHFSIHRTILSTPPHLNNYNGHIWDQQAHMLKIASLELALPGAETEVLTLYTQVLHQMASPLSDV